jgi:hypothetical protein
MKLVRKVLVGVALGAGVLALSAVNASAAVICSANVCWHSHENYHYPRAAHVVVHPDDWKWGPNVTIHEHEGRGYWRGEHWHAW